jgi:hypothetical protein
VSLRSSLRTAVRAALDAPAAARRLARDVGAIRRMMDDPACTNGYFGDAPRKPRRRVFADLLAWRLRRGEVNEYYYCWGLDRLDAPDPRALLSYGEFRTLRDRRNASDLASGGLNYIAILRDKYLFALVLRALDYPTPPLVGLLDEREVEWLEPRRRVALPAIAHGAGTLDVIAKPRFGIQGRGVVRLHLRDGEIRVDGSPATPAGLAAALGGPAVLQVPIAQHAALAALHPSSVNTLRVITVRDGREPRPFSRPLLRVGFGGSLVDNGNAGGLQAFVDPATGRVTGDAIMLRGGSLARHPDTDVAFDGFEIPHFHRAVELAVRLHAELPGLHSIGWDLAITDAGPVFVEGNDNWAAGLRIGLEPGFRDEFVRLCAAR